TFFKIFCAFKINFIAKLRPDPWRDRACALPAVAGWFRLLLHELLKLLLQYRAKFGVALCLRLAEQLDDPVDRLLDLLLLRLLLLHRSSLFVAVRSILTSSMLSVHPIRNFLQDFLRLPSPIVADRCHVCSGKSCEPLRLATPPTAARFTRASAPSKRAACRHYGRH